MICRQCLRVASRTTSSTTTTISKRFISSTSPNHATTTAPSQPSPRQGTPTSSHSPPAATSTSAAQPFSAPLTPSPGPETKNAAGKENAVVVQLSSVPAGTPLKGLNFLKNGTDPLAMADEEYPGWLWEVLKKQEGKAEAGAQGDLFSKSKKQRRLAAKRLRKEQAMNPELLAPKIPIYEQSVDLPGGDRSLQGAVRAGEARAELTRAMRGKRRSAIKEGNFLKSMS